MAGEWRTATVSELQRDGILLVEEGNHGEYRPRPDEFDSTGTPFIRAADIDSERPEEWRHTGIVLKPDTTATGYEPIRLDEKQADEVKVIAELVMVLGTENP